MPKKTYYNLSKDKKDRIFNAGVLEFSYHDLFDASVNRIVRIANVSKGSFYQYFEDKNEFYWYIVMEIILGDDRKYEQFLVDNKGDLFKAEELLFLHILQLFDTVKYKNLVANAYKTNFLTLRTKLSSRATTIYIDMYDLLTQYGFKGYNIRTKEDFLIVFDLLRNITNNTIITMITDHISKVEAVELYKSQMRYLREGITKRGLFG